MSFDFLICSICLRADRKLKYVDLKLTEYHNELCEYTANSAHQYCWECEHLLRKSYNFTNKCKEANKILQKWKETSDTERMPKTMVHKLLPQSLNLWTPTHNKIYKFSYCPNKHINVYRPESSTLNMTGNNTDKHTQIKSEADEDSVMSNLNGAWIDNHESNEPEDIMIKIERGTTIEYIDVNIDRVKTPINEDRNVNDHDISIDDLIKTNDLDDTGFNEYDDRNDSTNDSNCKQMDKFSDEEYDFHENNEKLSSKKDKTNKRYCLRKKSHAKSNYTTPSENNDTGLIETEDCPELESYLKKAEYIIGKLKIVSQDVDTIFDSYEKMLPKKKRRLLKEKSLICVKRGIVNARNMFSVGKMRQISESMNRVIENTEAVLKKMPIDRERCKAGLISKFESCGELKTKDGTIVDKQFVVSCLDDKVPEYYWRLLWKNVRQGNRNPPSPKEIQLYNVIQNKYKETKFNSIFEIEYLNSNEKMLEEFHRRISYESYVNAEYKCDICHQWFRLKSNMVKHMEQHKVNAGNVTCSICKLHFRDKLSRTRHHETHKVVYKCKACPMITHHRSSMVKHYSEHIGVRRACELCHKLYKNVNSHRIKVHKREHCCTICGDGFFTEDKLNTHRVRHEKQAASAGVASVKCDRCELEFVSENARLKHVKMTHTTPRWLHASGGGTSRTEKKIRTSYERRPITCEVCKTSGRNYWWMVNHAKKEHPNLDLNTCFAHVRKHLCHLCGAGFSNKYYLRDHMKSHGDMAAAEAIPYTARGPRSIGNLTADG